MNEFDRPRLLPMRAINHAVRGIPMNRIYQSSPRRKSHVLGPDGPNTSRPDEEARCAGPCKRFYPLTTANWTWRRRYRRKDKRLVRYERNGWCRACQREAKRESWRRTRNTTMRYPH